MKLLVTGGHLTPALATIDFIKQQEPSWEIIFIGREFSQEKTRQKSREKFEIKKRGLGFIGFSSPRFSTTQWWEMLLKLPRLSLAVVQALLILIRNRPNVILSFGGYLAVPVAFAGWILQIPILTHEQTRTSGLANRIIARWAQKVAISYQSSAQDFSQEKVVLTGNPLRSSLWQKKPLKPDWIQQQKIAKPILYVTGGNQGSEIINSVVAQTLPQITKKWLVIHQCGSPTSAVNYKTELEKKRKKLSSTAQKNYLIREWITAEELAWIYNHVQCVVSRSGANTTLELETLRIPAILIPLPFAYAGEQILNAQALVKQKIALLIEQKDFNAESLQKALAVFQTKSRRHFKRPSIEDITKPAINIYQLIKQLDS